MRGDPARQSGRRGNQHGFSLLELSVVVVIISVLLWAIARDFFRIQVIAEQTVTEQVTGTLQRSLGMKFAEYLVKGDTKRIEALEASNPMDFLGQVPNTYLGVLKDPRPAAIEGGHWYFDAGRRILVYQVRNAEQLTGGARNPARLRWVVRLEYEDRNGNRRFDSGLEQAVGVRLVPLEPFQWKQSQ